MFKEVIIVEGRDDTRRLKEIFPGIETLETNGSAINEETLKRIAKLQKARGAIVFTDPDFPGEKIRQTITQAVPGCMQAYLPKKEAIAKNKKGLGVEHASEAAIREALSKVMTPVAQQAPMIESRVLIDLRLIGHGNSSNLRELLSQRLGIGHVNGKQLQKRLQMFGITQEQVQEALKEI